MALQRWPLPGTITTLRGFLGFCNYYSEYVKDYASYAGPVQGNVKVGKEDAKKSSSASVFFHAT